MSNVKAGVAYVDVRLGSIEQFKQKMSSEIEKVGSESTKKLGDTMSKKVAPEGTKVGQTMARSFGGSFFSEGNRSFGGALTALARGNLPAFSTLMKRGASEVGQGFKTAFTSSASGIKGFFRAIPAQASAAFSSVVSSSMSAFSKIPGHVATARKAVDDFGKRVGFLAFQLQGFGTIASLAFTAPVAAALGLATVVGLKTAASIEQATASLKALTPAGTDVEALIKRLQALAIKSPIFNSTDLITFTQKMVASGLSVKQTEDFLKGFGNVALTVGADVGKIPFALEALVQMVGKGKVSMEELRQQLGDALPGAMKLVADGLGITTSKLYDMVKAGELTGEDIIGAFTKLGNSGKYLEGAGKSADTLGSKWQQLKESMQTQLGNIFLENSDKIKAAIDKLGPVFKDLVDISKPIFKDLIDGFGGFVDKIKELVDWYKALSPGQKDIVNKFALFLVVLGPLVLLGSGLGMIIAGLTSLFAALATPVGLVVLAIIAAVAVGILLYNWFKDMYDEGGKFKEWWDNFWNATMEVLKPIKEQFQKLWADIKEAFQQVKDSFAENKDTWMQLWEVLKYVGIAIGAVIATVFALLHGFFRGILGMIGPLFKMIGSIISGAVKFIGGVITFLIGFFTLDFKKMGDGLTSMWNGLWDLIVGTLVNAGKAIWGFISNFAKGFVDFWAWIYDVLVGHSIIPDMVNAIIAWFKRLVQRGVQFIKDLGKPFVNFYNDHIKPFVDGVGRGIDKVLDWVKGLGGKIKNAFSSAGSWLIDAGKNIVNGLIDGVKRMGSTLKNAILNLIPGPVRDIVANALGINSPSRVFMEFGKYVVLGFIQGVQKLAPTMAAEVGSAFDFAPPAVKPYLGDQGTPPVNPGGNAPKAAVLIENYHENGNDPDEIAEDLWFKINARGGVA